MIGFANLLVCIETLCYMEFYNKKQDETGQRTFQDESFIQNSFFSVRSENVRIAYG